MMSTFIAHDAINLNAQRVEEGGVCVWGGGRAGGGGGGVIIS